MFGTGANGKDALKQVVEEIFKVGISSASLSDFHSYDQGRKFPLAKLANSLINWSSENTQFLSLDSIQSIKHLVSGEKISIERKGQDEYPIECKAIGLFNCNELPSIRGALEAFKSRWAVIKFPYIFKQGAKKKNELEADPRFRYDLNFIREKVAPAFLNKILRELKGILKTGIDYSACEGSLADAQEQNNHLWKFCSETGLTSGEGKVYVSEIWQKLRDWYRAEEILKESDGKEFWSDLVGKYDNPVRSSNQIEQRIKELFPEVIGGKETQGELKGRKYLLGLTWKTSPSPDNPDKKCLVSDSASDDSPAKVSDEINQMVTVLQTLISISSPSPETEEDIKRLMKSWDKDFKKAVWGKLTTEEKRYIQSLKEPEPTTKPQPASNPAPAPTPPLKLEAGDRVKKKGDENSRWGTVKHIDDQIWVEWDKKDKKDLPETTREQEVHLILVFRKPKFVTNSEQKTYTGKIPKFAHWEAGQTVLSKSGKIVGKVVKGKGTGGVVLLNPTGIEEYLSYEDADLMEYYRVWILSPED